MNFLRRLISTESLVVFVICVFASIAFSRVQPQTLAGGGYGWDGLEYSKLYQFFSFGVAPSASFPFCNRIGTPFLASTLPFGEFRSFKLVNLLFGTVFAFSSYWIVRLRSSRALAAFVLLVCLTGFFSPFRFSSFYPVYTDPAFLGLTSIAVLALYRGYSVLSFFTLVFAYVFREAALYVLILFFIQDLVLRGANRRSFIGFLTALVSIFMIRAGISEVFNCSGSQIQAALFSLKSVFDPVRMVNFFAAISMTGAPFVFLPKVRELDSLERVSLMGFVFSVLLAFLGGSDSTRIFFSFFPLYALALASAFRRKGIYFMLFSGVGYFLTNRVGQRIADPQNYWPARDEFGFFWQFPDHARPEVGLCILCVWLLLFFIYQVRFRSVDGRAEM